jgi:hypothetical protein
MTKDSWIEIIYYALRPQMLLFFGLSPILVWGLNKEIYSFVGSRFWYMGIVMGFLEFVAYLIAGLAFYRKLPSQREFVAFILMALALFIGNDK